MEEFEFVFANGTEIRVAVGEDGYHAHIIADMTEQQITAMILRLQAQLNEKQQVKKLVKNNEPDDLPF